MLAKGSICSNYIWHYFINTVFAPFFILIITVNVMDFDIYWKRIYNFKKEFVVEQAAINIFS